MSEQVYTNYRLQLTDEEVWGTLVVQDGKIADIQPDRCSQGQDGQGDYLLPGLVELHTDNLEQCLAPRPKVEWPLNAATIAHDRELISAGITTVCDAIAIGSIDPSSPRNTTFKPLIETLREKQQSDRFAVDHYLHLRCELGWEDISRVVGAYVTDPRVKLISLMDHTPGQRQFVDLERYKTYYQGRYGVSDEALDAFIQDRLAAQRDYGIQNRQDLVVLARAHAIPLASHDDATVEHVDQALAEGIVIAEFPTTLAAAHHAHRHHLNVLMGAPNVMLGGSHSGNISALELLEKGLVRILSSDYVPQSLLQSLFAIAQWLNHPLHQVIPLATLYPAAAIGLDHDRGSLAIGKRADFITVHADSLGLGIVPRLTAVYCNGHRVG